MTDYNIALNKILDQVGDSRYYRLVDQKRHQVSRDFMTPNEAHRRNQDLQSQISEFRWEEDR
jgi:serine/threonine protein phosphatase PrpC